jgi:hypothetical protein
VVLVLQGQRESLAWRRRKLCERIGGVTLAVMLAIAAHVWPISPCGPPHVEYVSEPPLQLEGSAPCTLYARRGDTALETCTDIVHQWGHLDGLRHASDERNVMAAVPRPYWRCRTKRGIHGFTRAQWLRPPSVYLQ